MSGFGVGRRGELRVDGEVVDAEVVDFSQDALGNGMVLLKIFPDPAEPSFFVKRWELVSDVEVVEP